MASKKVKIGEVQNKVLDTTTTTTDLNKRLWRLKTKYQILIVWLRKQIITLKCKNWENNVLLLLVIVNPLVKRYLMQI